MKLKLLKTTFIMVLLLVIFLVFHPLNTIFAQDQTSNQRIKYLLNVTPAIINFELVKGQIQTFELTVENFLDRPMGIRTTLEPFTYPDQSSDHLKESPILDWADVSSSEFIIDAQSKETITVTINVPRDAPIGGQYAVLFLTPFYSQEAELEIPTVLSKVGVLLIGSYGQTDYVYLKENVQIPTFSFPLITDKKEVNTNLRVHNDYFNHFTGKPFIKIAQILGEENEIELEEKNILPKTERAWQQNIDIEPNFPLALYAADLSFSIGEGNQINKRTYFMYLPGVSYIKYSLLLILLILAFIFRKRLKKAAKTLLTKG